jgi:predicted Zn-dependent protease with MMP-like domain
VVGRKLGKYNEEMIFLYQNEIQEAKAMHKEETVDLIVQYEIKHHLIFTEEGILNTVKKAEQYYNETFGGEE